ncbi:MAG: PIG-L family deacetylase [Bacteroidetes bacterium]|nr:MAG: PIG-L family deacetylase [Bacteroidota bacterium]
MMKRFSLFVFASVISVSLNAQSSGQIQKKIEKLNTFQKVLYIAAHPDDENTRVIAWLGNGRNAEVRYLSLTRGDGGQNMIGTELGPHLGILRTQELLAARSIDGGTQAFSRAVDFGYSKTSDETLEKWNHDVVLGDVVRAIRTFRPDVIVTRFPPDSRGGHGHHTASAMLALEAYELAANPDAFPEQLNNEIEPWQPKSVYWNTYSWRWDPNLDSLAANDPKYIKSDIGGYDRYLGESYVEIGSKARSQHKCQGFGVSITMGETFEYFQHLKGDVVEEDLLESIDRSWETVGATPEVARLAEAIQEEFDPQHPEASLPKLLALRAGIVDHLEQHWAQIKLQQVDELIADCAGLYVEVIAEDWSALPGVYFNAEARLIARGTDGLSVTSVTWPNGGLTLKKAEELPLNRFFTQSLQIKTPMEVSQPYWLRAPFDASYHVTNPTLIGLPQNPPVCEVEFRIEYENASFFVRVPVDYKWSDRVEGEQRRPFVVSPRATATFDEPVFIFASDESKTVRIRVKSFEDDFSTAARLKVPEGWSVSPRSIPLDFTDKYEEKVVAFEVTPPAESSEGTLQPELAFVSDPIQEFTEIAYPHIPTQVVFGNAQSKVVRLNLVIDKGTIGYIQGAGDEVDVAIQQMGFHVVNLSENDLANSDDLGMFQTIVIGIRAYNVHPWLLNYKDKLMKYVENGGNLVVQYNTATRDLLSSDIGPYPFTIGRDRVTEEDARVRFIDPAHPFFNNPNAISESDFEGWVQERGLYFATDWDKEYQPLLSWHDEGEPARIGGLIFAPYGKGSYTYVGISFFRELPAGVPGAFRLLANILSYE